MQNDYYADADAATGHENVVTHQYRKCVCVSPSMYVLEGLHKSTEKTKVTEGECKIDLLSIIILLLSFIERVSSHWVLGANSVARGNRVNAIDQQFPDLSEGGRERGRDITQPLYK